jgi:sodium transport system permease protein
MMRTTLTVFLKEVLDNFRDRRTLASALLMGPVFGPVLFAFVINLSIERSLEDVEKIMDLPVIGKQYAPNLIGYLRAQNIDVVAGPVDKAAAMEAVKTGRHDVVLVIPATFGEQLADMVPARLELVSDQANTDAERVARRARNALHDYNQQLAGLRIIARGINPVTLRPFNIDEIDVSTPSGRSAMLLGMMSYFFIFAALMGGMYLAIDTTAGERERGSLEPLLSLPVTRAQLILGKIGATCLFMTLSLMLSLTAFYFSLRFMPLEQLGMTPNFGIGVVLSALAIFLPFILVGAALISSAS